MQIWIAHHWSNLKICKSSLPIHSAQPFPHPNSGGGAYPLKRKIKKHESQAYASFPPSVFYPRYNSFPLLLLSICVSPFEYGNFADADRRRPPAASAWERAFKFKRKREREREGCCGVEMGTLNRWEKERKSRRLLLPLF